MLAAANDELSVWRLQDLTCLQRITCEHATFHALANLPPGQIIAADATGALRVFRLADGAEMRHLTPHSGLVPSIATDLASRRFATVSYDQSVRLWDIEALERPEPAGHQQQVTALALAPGGDRLLSASKDGRVLVWEARTGALMAELGHHDHWVSGISAVSGNRAVSAGWDGAIRIWDMGLGQDATVIRTGDKHVACLACSAEGTGAVTVSTDGTVRVWDLAAGVERAVMNSPDKQVVAVAMDGDCVRWMTEAGCFCSWSIHGELSRIDIPGADRVTACDLGLPGESCVVGLASGQLLEVKATGVCEAFGQAGCGPTSIARDASGRVLLAAHGVPHVVSDNTARLWAREDRSAATAVLVGDVPWTAAEVSDDGRHMYLGDDAGAVHVVEPVVPGLTRPARTRDRRQARDRSSS